MQQAFHLNHLPWPMFLCGQGGELSRLEVTSYLKLPWFPFAPDSVMPEQIWAGNDHVDASLIRISNCDLGGRRL